MAILMITALRPMDFQFSGYAIGALAGWRREDFAIRTDSDLAQLALIRAGAGIGDALVEGLQQHAA